MKRDVRRLRREPKQSAMLSNPFSGLPTSVEIDGVTHPINSDFRFGISLEMEVVHSDDPDVSGLLAAFYPSGVPRNVRAAADKMLEFYRGYMSTMDSSTAKNENKKGRQYDYEQDADVLIASFLNYYGVDLTKDKLHWWAFRRLMLNLPDESPFMQRIHYRIADINKVDKKLQKHYRKMKSLYSLKTKNTEAPMTVKERDAALKEKMRRRFEEAHNATGS